MTTKFLIVDDHEMTRRGLRSLIEDHPDWQVCAEARTGLEAVAFAIEHHPDVAILDVTMPELDGIDAARRLRKAAPRTRILILTMHEDEEIAERARQNGAHGLLSKTRGAAETLDAIESLLRQGAYWPPRLAPGERLPMPRPPLRAAPEAGRSLTRRELEIVQLVTEGKTTKTIAEQLGISVKTVETHRTNVMRKLGVHSAPALVRYAVRHGLVEP